MREFDFELRLCARLERDGVPGLGDPDIDDSDTDDPCVVARQLGTSVHAAGGRIVDTVCVLPGPEFEDRVDLTSDAIPPAVFDADLRVGEWTRVTRAFDGPPERARSLAERGAETGFLDVERRDNQTVVRQAARYPDWVDGLVGIENKPDLGRPGDLRLQMRHDASLGVLDYAILATESHVTRAHLNRLPDAVGVWQVDHGAGSIDVVREPERLDSDGPGLEVLEEHPGETEVRPVTAAEKARQRRRVAERAYGKGWRTYELPPCAEAEAVDDAGAGGLPFCTFKDRLVDAAAECGQDCAGFDPADAPTVDLGSERERRTAWRSDAGGRRRQSGLDQF